MKKVASILSLLLCAICVQSLNAQTPTVYVNYAHGVHIDDTKDFVWGSATIQNLNSTQYHWIATLSNGQQSIVIYDQYTPSDTIIAEGYTLPMNHANVYFLSFKVQAVINNRVTPWYNSPPVAIMPHNDPGEPDPN